VTLDDLREWLDAYGQAWERQDVDASVACFSEDAEYHWGPFGEPLRGHAEIRSRTEEAVSRQSNIVFEHELLAVTPDGRGLAWWTLTHDIPAVGTRLQDEGVFLVTLDADGRCRKFREWWSEREISR
jgi:ketosteroid isomerase-like protein